MNDSINAELDSKPTLDAVLQCHQLNKVYYQGEHELQVLKNLDFTLVPGERVAIIGASGSGKTTLLNLLGGIDKPSSGNVVIAGQDVSNLSSNQQDKIRNQTLGFVYQFHHLLGEFSAQENVAMPLIIARQNYQDCMDKAALLLEKVGLKERMSHKPSQLSGGERQRVAIARALVNEPAFVLMDEPTGNLDSHTAEAIHDLMHELNKNSAASTSFVVVTHDHALAEQMDRVLLLKDGELVAQEKTNEAKIKTTQDND